MYTLRLGKSISARAENFYELIDKAKTLGFQSVDFDLCIGGFFYSDEDILECKKRLQYILDSGLFLNGVHIPYGGDGRDVSRLDEQMRRLAVKNITELTKIVDEYRPFCYILHGSFEPIMDKDRKTQLKQLVRSMKELSGVSKSPIVLENLPRTCLLNTSEEMLWLCKKVKNLRFCLDTNHFLRERTHEAIENLKGKIVTMHVSDHNYVNEQHWLPGKGTIEWDKLLSALEKIGYNGVFNYELGVELEEVKANFDELFTTYNQGE